MIRAPELFGARGFMGRHNIYFSSIKEQFRNDSPETTSSLIPVRN
jgi:hypothetical protein